MLGKLMKYEMKATGRTFLPMFALLVIFALINKFFLSINADYFQIPQVIAMVAFVVIIAGICVMTLIVTIQRFNKNLLTDEGYLSFTLPVKVHTQIDCKMIVSFIWCILSILISALAIFILAANQETLAELRQGFGEFGTMLNQVGSAGYIIIFEVILLVIISTLSSITTIYASIAIGNLSSKHKLLASLGAFLGFGMIEQIVGSILISCFSGNFERYVESLEHANISEILQFSQLMLLILIIFTAVFGVAYYFLTEWMLRKKLNLE